MDSFNARTWPACYVEWWFGDCAPGLDRERPMLFEQVARRLIDIQEHEYTLATDDVPAGRVVLQQRVHEAFGVDADAALEEPAEAGGREADAEVPAADCRAEEDDCCLDLLDRFL